MNARKTAAAITEITDRLANLLLSENEILVDRKPRELLATLEEKEFLTADYEQKMLELKHQPDELKRLENGEMERLRTATHRFQDALEDHRRLIQASKSVTERMITAITDEIATRDRPASGYDQQAAVTDGFVNKRPQAVTLAYDQTV